MKIINVNKNDAAPISQQTTLQSSLLEKIKKIITNVFRFIRENTSCIHESDRAISKEGIKPLDLSHDIAKALEESDHSKRDITLITFSFNDLMYDKSVWNEPLYMDMNKHIYDIPRNNKLVGDEPIYEEINDPLYDNITTNDKLVSEELIYNIPRNNKPVLDEPIYAEIYDVPRNHKVSMDTPPPLPPRNPVI